MSISHLKFKGTHKCNALENLKDSNVEFQQPMSQIKCHKYFIAPELSSSVLLLRISNLKNISTSINGCIFIFKNPEIPFWKIVSLQESTRCGIGLSTAATGRNISSYCVLRYNVSRFRPPPPSRTLFVKSISLYWQQSPFFVLFFFNGREL